jgi:thiosulfate/3-mercaptopyruvate sulfurtransferase
MVVYPLVPVTWLAEHLQDPNVVIVDCRFTLADPHLGRQQYQDGHIPGAFYLDLNQDLSDVRKSEGGRHPLPDVDALAQTFSRLGIRSGDGEGATLVVAYDASRFAFAARLWWLLRYLGHDRVVVLDGGFPAWQAAGYPLSQTVRSPQADTPNTLTPSFVPEVRSHWVKTRAEVQAHLGLSGAVLVDSREPARYRGETEPIDPVAGHIPGAFNVPWQTVTDEQGFAYPVEQQAQRWGAIAQDALDLTVYCGSGVTACVNLLSLEMAGIPGAALYAGSWSDWCSDDQTPKVTARSTSHKNTSHKKEDPRSS